MEELIRRCTPDDASAIAAIYDPIVAHTAISFEETPPGPAELQRRIVAAGDRFPWFAFQRDARVLGYVYAAQHRSRAAYRWAVDVSVYVDPSAHGEGVGRRLYATLFDVLAHQGYCVALAGVALPNEASVRLHLGAGFAPVGTYHRVGFKFGRWHDVTWFERRLRYDDGPAAPRSLAEILEHDDAAVRFTRPTNVIDAAISEALVERDQI